jgi:hypothetical protein
MATMPQPAQAAPGASQDLSQGDPSQGADQSDGGYCIEVEVSAQGQITVSVESSDQEDSEQPGQDDDGAGDMPVPSIKAACQMVEQIFKNNGQMPGGQSQMSVQDAFGQGFQGTAG